MLSESLKSCSACSQSIKLTREECINVLVDTCWSKTSTKYIFWVSVYEALLGKSEKLLSNFLSIKVTSILIGHINVLADTCLSKTMQH